VKEDSLSNTRGGAQGNVAEDLFSGLLDDLLKLSQYDNDNDNDHPRESNIQESLDQATSTNANPTNEILVQCADTMDDFSSGAQQTTSVDSNTNNMATEDTQYQQTGMSSYDDTLFVKSIGSSNNNDNSNSIEWKCIACGYTNFNNDGYCTQCETPKPLPLLAPIIESGQPAITIPKDTTEETQQGEQHTEVPAQELSLVDIKHNLDENDKPQGIQFDRQYNDDQAKSDEDRHELETSVVKSHEEQQKRTLENDDDDFYEDYSALIAQELLG
jgi:hypothetical protein